MVEHWLSLNEPVDGHKYRVHAVRIKQRDDRDQTETREEVTVDGRLLELDGIKQHTVGSDINLGVLDDESSDLVWASIRSNE